MDLLPAKAWWMPRAQDTQTMAKCRDAGLNSDQRQALADE
jgi:hypothetical protein